SIESQLYIRKQHAGGGLETYLLKKISENYLHTSNVGYNSHTSVGIRILDTSMQEEALKHTCSRTFLETSTKHLT
ncbi:15723_t:CDS:1, partial [Funneliformis mosseae]